MTAAQYTEAQVAPDEAAPATPSQQEREPRPTERRPTYFGDPSRPLFGWVHRPVQGASAPFGLVICNAFGNEGICAHRSVRHFAESAARAGIATLRFDYDGTGDAAGHDFESDRLAAWIASAHAAADEIRAATGVARVCFAGIRLGAAIAMLAALERADVMGLIAIAPVISGKAYLRELRLLTRAIEAKSNSGPGEATDMLQTAGFALSAQTQQSVLGIDLKRTAKAPAPHILVLDRAELPAGDSWPQHLRNIGADAHRIVVTGYTEMMLDSHETVVPRQMIGAALSWLADLAPKSGAAAGSSLHRILNREPWTGRDRCVVPHLTPDDPVTGPGPQATVEEFAVRFGTASNLFGILSAPQSQRRDRPLEQAAVLLLNAGAVHHVGPNRLYAALARHLARAGHVVLRMDLAGIGDSPAHEGAADNVVYPKSALRDVGEAIAYLRREWGAVDVRAVGLCSGAYHAFKACVAHQPLTDAVMINPLTFFAKEGMSLKYPEHRVAADIMRYRTNAMRFASWRKLFSGGVNLPELGHVLARWARAVAIGTLRAPARLLGVSLGDDLASELRTALKAPARLHFVFAAGDPGLELLRSQGGRTAQRLLTRGQIGMHIIHGADHTFTDLSARTELAGTLARILGAPMMHPQRPTNP